MTANQTPEDLESLYVYRNPSLAVDAQCRSCVSYSSLNQMRGSASGFSIRPAPTRNKLHHLSAKKPVQSKTRLQPASAVAKAGKHNLVMVQSETSLYKQPDDVSEDPDLFKVKQNTLLNSVAEAPAPTQPQQPNLATICKKEI